VEEQRRRTQTCFQGVAVMDEGATEVKQPIPDRLFE
jgi:hypothetical protein